MRTGLAPDAAALIIGDDAVADRIFSGDFDVAVREVPEPDRDAIAGRIAETAAALDAGVSLAVTLKSKFCLPNLDRYAEALRGNSHVSCAMVASVEDGIRLRLLGLTQRIALIYVQPPTLAPLFEAFALEPAVPGAWWLDQVHQRTSRPLAMHLWVDTGLGREGVMPGEALAVARGLRRGEFAGLATHLASVPYRYPDGSFDHDTQVSDAIAAEQIERFAAVDAALAADGLTARSRHVLSSGGLQRQLRHAYYDMVRPGRQLVERLERKTRRALVVRTRVNDALVAAVKELPAGWSSGYFNGSRLAGPRRVAVLTTQAGTLFGGGTISVLKSGRQHVLPIDLAHGGMCVVRADGVALEAGDRVALNPPDGLLREFQVPLPAAFAGRLHDPLRDRTLTLSLRRRLSLRFQAPDRHLVATAALPRYSVAAARA